MNIDRSGIEFLKSLEGCRLEPYRCEAGVWTIGYGHTANVTKDTPAISPDEAEEFLRDDLSAFEKLLGRTVEVALTQNQYNAVLSFLFNIGAEKFLKSTFLRVLISGDVRGAAKELDKWVHVRDPKTHELVVSSGLRNRREKEKALLLSDFETKRKLVQV